MNLKNLQKNWNALGKIDPLWSILTDPLKKGNKWKLDEFFETGEKEIASIMNYIKSININLKKDTALDFGCGVGRLTQALANYFDRVYGVDIAPSMIKLAKNYNKYSDRCRYYLNEREDLALFADDNFDFIYSSLTLQHMTPKYSLKYIKEFIRILKPEGILIFQVLSEKNLPKLKRFIKSILKLFSEFYSNTKSQVFNQPVMENYELKRDTIISLIKKQRAEIIDIKESPCTTPSDFLSFRYVITK